MYRTSMRRFIRVTFRCDCQVKVHEHHWRFDFEVFRDGRLSECEDASSYIAYGHIEDTLMFGAFDFMEWRARKLAEHFLSSNA